MVLAVFFPRMLHFHGFTGFSWIFMVFIVFMDFHDFHGLVIVKSVSESYPDHFGSDECDSEPRLERSGAIRVK